MKKTLIGLVLVLSLTSALNAQTKSLTGKVTGYDCTMRGWCSITVKSGMKEYSILVEAGAFAPAEQRSDGSFPRSPSVPRTVGNVTKIGRTVQVTYNSGTWEYGDLRAAKIVEIMQSRKKK